MTTHTLIGCGPHRVTCRSRRLRKTLANRVTAVALAIAALLVVLYGEQWTLELEAPAGIELTAVAHALATVYGDADAAALAKPSRATTGTRKANHE